MAVKKVKLPNNTTLDINDARVVSDGITYIGEDIDSATYDTPSTGSVVTWGTESSNHTVPLIVDGVSKTVALNGYSSGGGGGDENIIEAITFNGSSVPVTNKTAAITGQDVLVSGTNIKTINNQSILGSGNITIEGGGGGLEEVVLDTSELIPNTYISNSNGSEVSYSGWSSTDFIDISDGIQIKADRRLSYSAFYNSSETFVSAVDIKTEYTAIPSSAKYVRISGSNSDMSAATVTLLAAGGSSGGGEENVIEIVKVNGTALTPDANKAVDVTVPTESTVSGWGFTKNTGTLTGVSFNGASATVTSGVAAITATIPTVPTISTNITTDATSDTKTASPKAVKTYVDGIVGDIETLLAAI